MKMLFRISTLPPKRLMEREKLAQMLHKIQLPRANETRRKLKEFAHHLDIQYSEHPLEKRKMMIAAVNEVEKAWTNDEVMLKQELNESLTESFRRIKHNTITFGFTVVGGLMATVFNIGTKSSVWSVVTAMGVYFSAKSIIDYIKARRIYREISGEMQNAKEALEEAKKFMINMLKELAWSDIPSNRDLVERTTKRFEPSNKD